MVTVKKLRDLLATMPDSYEVVIYPKYSSDKVNGYDKHTFRLDQVCEQEPYGAIIKHDQNKIKEYFLNKTPKRHDLNNHVAILF